MNTEKTVKMGRPRKDPLEKVIPLTVTVKTHQLYQIQRIADERSMSVSELSRSIIRGWLEQNA